MTILILSVGAILLAGLLYFESRNNGNGILPVKTALSLLFIVTALIQPHPDTRYYYPLLVGLFFCLGGDVLLALPQEKAFLIGLVSFLLGHVLYIVAFGAIAQISRWTAFAFLPIAVLGFVIYRWLGPYLGDMKKPVIVYIVVISIMVLGALSVQGRMDISGYGRLMVLVGALSFYFSDIFVARDRFVNKGFVNRWLGLPLYYLGQFLLAFSVGVVGS